jgi:hypothetical protein
MSQRYPNVYRGDDMLESKEKLAMANGKVTLPKVLRQKEGLTENGKSGEKKRNREKKL